MRNSKALAVLVQAGIIGGLLCSSCYAHAETTEYTVSQNDTVAITEEESASISEDALKAAEDIETAYESADTKYEGVSGDLHWKIDTEGNLTISGEGDYEQPEWNQKRNDWWKYRYEIRTATVNVTGITSTASMFADCGYLTKVDLSGLDTGKVTTMKGMFQNCSRLKSLDLSSLDTGSVTDMMNMFQKCIWLSEIDLSGLNLGSVETMSAMFQNCISLKKVKLDNTTTGRVRWMSSMFNGCCNLEDVNLDGLDTHSAESMQYMFYGCDKLKNLDLYSFNTGAVTDMSNMFALCKNLQTLNISSFRTGAVIDMQYMFYSCEKLKSLDLRQLDKGHVRKMNYMFAGCKELSLLQLQGWNVTAVTDMQGMFWECKSLEQLDLGNFDTSSVTDMRAMFFDCEKLKSLDLHSFATGSVTDMGSVFSGCSSLSELSLAGFRTENVTTMNGMFSGCSSLKTLDISSFRISAVTDVTYMMDGCNSLTEIVAPPNMQKPIDITYKLSAGYWYNDAGEQCNSIVAGVQRTVVYTFAEHKKESNFIYVCDPVVFYTGKKIRAVTEVWYYDKEKKKDIVLKEDKDYVVEYRNNIKPGTASYVVKGKGKYAGEETVEEHFVITDQLDTPELNSLQYQYQSGDLQSFQGKTKYSLYIEFYTVQNYATGYELELSDKKGKKLKIIKFGSSKKNMIQTTFQNMTQDIYGVRVRAVHGKVRSKWSKRMYAVKQPKVQGRSYKGMAQIRWKKLSGADGYEIYMSRNKKGGYVKVASAGKNASMKSIRKIKKRKLKAGTYYYYVLAKKKAGKDVYYSNMSYFSKVIIK